jgi:iron complex outermembrane receptor protein
VRRSSWAQADGGIYAYGEVEDSNSFYRGLYPKRQILEVSADFDLNNGWSTAFGGMVFHSTGDVQTPGWNRLTQDLIDNRTYITGRDTSLVDADGNGRLTPNEVGLLPVRQRALHAVLRLPRHRRRNHTLDTGLGTTKLDPRTVYISPPTSRRPTNTLYFDLAKRSRRRQRAEAAAVPRRPGEQALRLATATRPGSTAKVSEARATYAFPRDVGAVSAQHHGRGRHRGSTAVGARASTAV